MFKGLSLDQAPPFEAPLLFFTEALIFGLATGVSILFGNSSFGTLHLFTLGFLGYIMIGALQQMLPVVVGVSFKRPILFSLLLFFPLTAGLILFFLTLEKGYNLFFLASLFLFLAIAFFTLTTLYKLFKAPHTTDTVIAMRLALFSFFIAAALGAHILASFGLQKAPNSSFLLTHALFAGFGWVGLLIMGVSYQVIPMFYVTQEIPELYKKWLAPVGFSLIVLSAITLFINKKLSLMLFVTLLFIYIFYAVLLLQQIKRRKRAIKEPSIAFWQLGLITLFFLPLLFFIDSEKFALLFLFGFATSIIFGMLYKIIPFLSWFHISSWGFFDMPTMKEMINEKLAFIHLGVHIATLLALFINLKIFGALFALSIVLLGVNLLKPVRIYFTYKKKPSPFAQFKKS
ncbi:hypothetical protein [Nitratiruptor tergarcus]|uniref:Uncharacterized protein n=1 Tax=Nitratiruptor tergarcus DSM 16512 TaxID=1069081 RepID=A0A1W1WVS1_9BACT|nr:hypothetical protein [Nitratiruptor tergarcus]SMC10140.1 hypothetical protein SAMN05660197_1979 [Nitratiruptor tergarcus DSM 16512]